MQRYGWRASLRYKIIIIHYTLRRRAIFNNNHFNTQGKKKESRYIRRGGFYNYPDTASAFLTYSYLKENGSIGFDPIEGKFKVDFDRLETDIENLTGEVFEVFAEGNMSHAKELVNRWGDINQLGQDGLPGELEVLEDTTIPHYIDFNFITKDRILFDLV